MEAHSATGAGRTAGLREVIVLAGGERVVTPLSGPLPPADTVIAADSGLASAATLGLKVDLVVGDLDSVDRDDLARAEALGTRIDRHREDKDRTDLAIALDTVCEQGPALVTVIGGHGGRLDHLLANVALLAAPQYAQLRIRALLGSAQLHVVRDEVTLEGEPHELVSLLAVHGEARGVTTHGLRFPLHGAALHPGSSRGVSNRFSRQHAHISLDDGVLVAVQPGPDDTDR